jgi:GTP diphosphokinase / guanosine-3',5'-bis(diphosphate) 3'-diphosphatase
MKNMLATAIAFAAEKHNSQADKAGMPYILHPLKVMHYLDTDDFELMCIAVLHDVVEDCKVTYDDLREIGMSERVVDGVKGMTKVPGESRAEKMARITRTKDIRDVKKADLRHNMDARRLIGVEEKDRKRMDEYCKMYWELKHFKE